MRKFSNEFCNCVHVKHAANYLFLRKITSDTYNFARINEIFMDNVSKKKISRLFWKVDVKILMRIFVIKSPRCNVSSYWFRKHRSLDRTANTTLRKKYMRATLLCLQDVYILSLKQEWLNDRSAVITNMRLNKIERQIK